MAFDANKVQFTADELTAAASADVIYESLKDGASADDLIVILPQVLPLFAFLKSDQPVDYATKLIALGVMLMRDNEFLAKDTPPV
jgi:hypothetical protein